MARCGGCGGAGGGGCGCVLTVASPLTLTGSGSSINPWVAGVNCQAAACCVGPTLGAGQGMQFNPGPCSLSVRPSAAVNNAVTFGPDGGVYVGAASAGGATTVDTPLIDMSGTGLTGDPLRATKLARFVKYTRTADQPVFANQWNVVAFPQVIVDLLHDPGGLIPAGWYRFNGHASVIADSPVELFTTYTYQINGQFVTAAYFTSHTPAVSPQTRGLATPEIYYLNPTDNFALVVFPSPLGGSPNLRVRGFDAAASGRSEQPLLMIEFIGDGPPPIGPQTSGVIPNPRL